MGKNEGMGDNIEINGQTYVKKRKMPFKFIIILVVILVIVVLVCGLISKIKAGFFGVGDKLMDEMKDVYDEKIVGTEGEVTTITQSTIKDVFEISELQTADYIYNAVTEVHDPDSDELKYHVAYEGKVTAGIDFHNIEIDINEASKEIRITVPTVSIQEAVVDAGTLQYIFEKESYNDETVFKEAYATCQADLEERAKTEDKFLEMAKENARQVIEALVVPWVSQIDSEYMVVVK